MGRRRVAVGSRSFPFDGVTRTPAFMRDPRRACAPENGIDPDLFFDNGKAEQACYICGRCPFRNQCLSYAVQHHEEWGVWGGKSRKARTHAERKVRK